MSYTRLPGGDSEEMNPASATTGQMHDAPEVVQSHSDLIPAQVPGSQSPEMVHPEQYQAQYGYSKLDAESAAPSYSPANGFTPSHEKKDALAALPLDSQTGVRPRRRKRWTWAIIGVVLLLLAIGLGVGLGVGLSSNNGDNNNEGINESSNQTSPTTTTTSSPPASTTAAAITSGTAGLAEYSCNNTATTESSSGTPFLQDCNVQFQVGHPSYYSQNVTMQNLEHRTVYTFQSCLDECDRWNSGSNTPACRAVTYYANITTPIQLWGGNCFMKNDRGVGYRTDPVDYDHTASAWMSCLNVTCSGSD